VRTVDRLAWAIEDNKSEQKILSLVAEVQAKDKIPDLKNYLLQYWGKDLEGRLRNKNMIRIMTGFSLTAQAQVNVLLNPGFTSNFDGWIKYFNRVGEWDSMDAADDPGSGSAFLSNIGTSDGIVPFVLAQCIPLQGGQQIEFGGDLLLAPGQPSGSAAFIFIEPFTNSDCAGTAPGFFSTSSSQSGDWASRSAVVITSSEVLSVRLSLGVFKPSGETADASAYFDNIFLNLSEDNGEFQINPAMSASFFNPAEGGHGIMIHLLDANTAWMCWFAFDNAGNPAWICGIGTVAGDTITFEDAFTVEGGAFPPNFDPAQIVEVPWGTITVVFTGCNEGSMSWTTSAPGFQSGSMPLVRLTTLWGNSCS